MTNPEKYAAWIVKNADKKGTPEFDTVVAAYNAAKQSSIIEPSQEEMAAAQQSLARETRSMEPVTFPEGLQAYFSRDKRNQIAQEGRTQGFLPPEPEQVTRIGLPVAAGLGAGLLTGGMGAAPAFYATTGVSALASAASEFAAQGTEKMTGEREEYNPKAIVGAGILGATPVYRPFSAVAPSTAKNILALAGNLGTQAGINVGIGAGAELVETGKVSPSAAVINAGVGTFIGGLNTVGDRMAKTALARETARITFEAAGIPFSDVPIQYIVPQSGRFSDRLIPIVDSNASRQDAAFRQTVLDRAQAGASELVEGGAIAQELQQFVNTLDETDKLFASQSNEAAKAALAVQDAEAALDLAMNNPAMIEGRDAANQAVNAARENLRLTRAMDIKRAAAAYSVGQTPEGLVYSPSESAGVWENRVRRPMDALIKTEAERRFSPNLIGIKPDQGLLTVNDLTDSINTVKTRLNAGDGELAINFTKQFGEDASLTLNDIRAVRKNLMDSLDNAPEGNKRADALILALDAEIANRTRASIEGIAGKEGLAAYDSANRYYRGVMQAKTNPQGRALLGRKVNDEAADALVSKMANGNYDEYNAAIKYIDSVATDAPEMQVAMKRRLNEIVRNTLVSKRTTNPGAKNQILDVDGLLSDIEKIGASKMRNKAFRIEELGFGTSEQIRETRNTLRGFVGRTMSEADLKDFYASPAVIRALSSGIGFSEAARASAARIGSAQNAYAAEMLRISGSQGKASILLTRARDMARTAGLNLDETNALIAKQKTDPVLSAFSGGRYFGLKPNEAQPDFGRFIGFLENPNQGTLAEKKSLIRALEKQNPRLFEQIKSRFLVDKLLATANPRNPNLRFDLDYQGLDQVLYPSNISDKANLVAVTEIVLGPETFAQLNKIGPLIAQVAKSERILASTNPSIQAKRAGQVVGGLRALPEGKLAGAVGTGATASAFYEFIDSARGHLAAFFLQNPIAFKVYQGTGNIAKALGSLGTQRAATLLANDPELAYLVGVEQREKR